MPSELHEGWDISPTVTYLRNSVKEILGPGCHCFWCDLAAMEAAVRDYPRQRLHAEYDSD
jgi:hypothetical protein